jgi:hypothetical protein
MSKTNDIKKTRELTEDELDAVAGGRTDLIKAMGNTKDGATNPVTASTAVFGALRGASGAVSR